MMLYSWVLPVPRALRALGESGLPVELAHAQRWLTLVRARPAVELAMTCYEGSALRIPRDLETSVG